MEKLILIMTILATFSCASYGNEEEVVPELPKEFQLSILTSCKEFAAEDNIENEMLADYLLDCVNSDLKEYGYQEITDLPVDEELPVSED